jgi:hypothetical protein
MADVELSFEDLTFGVEEDSKEPDIKEEVAALCSCKTDSSANLPIRLNQQILKA